VLVSGGAFLEFFELFCGVLGYLNHKKLLTRTFLTFYFRN
jgi:hypothetical protein